MNEEIEINQKYGYLKKVAFSILVFIILAGAMYYISNSNNVQTGSGGNMEVTNKTVLSSTLRNIDEMLLNL